MYFGAEHLMGFLTVWPSAQWYSYFGPADMMGQLSSVQNSVIVPYNMLIWLKKSTAGRGQRECLVVIRDIYKNEHSLLTATHSFWSSPSGSITANLRLPDPSVAAACFIKSYWWVPSGMFFLGLNVLDERLPLRLRSKRPSAMGVNKIID